MKLDDIMMWILTGLAGMVCLMLILGYSPWVFILSYWIVTLIRNGLIIQKQKKCKKEIA